MKLLNNILIVFGLCLSFSALAALDGVLEVHKDLQYKRLWWSKTTPSGKFAAKLKTRSSKLVLKFKDQNGKRHYIKIKIPRNSLPTRSGELRVPSLLTKQPFSIYADLNNSTEERSPSRDRLESCTYRRPYRYCYINENGRRICETRYEDRRGQRRIRYHILTLHKNLNLAIDIKKTDSDDREVLADFSGQESTRQTVYEHRGICRE